MDNFCEINHQKERIVITNHRKCAAGVPFEDLECLKALEDAEDIHEAELALKEIAKTGSISFDEMIKSLA